MLKKININLNLKTKIMSIMIGLVLISLVTLAYFSYRVGADSLNEASLNRFYGLVDEKSTEIELRLHGVERLSLSISETRAMNNLLNNQTDENYQRDICDLITAVVNSQKDVTSMFVVNNSGIVIADSSQERIGTDLSDRVYVVSGLAGKDYLSQVFFNNTDSPIISYSLSLHNQEGRVEGALISFLDFDSLVRYPVQDYELGDSGYFWAVDDKGVLVAHPDEENVFNLNLAEYDNEELRNIIQRMHTGERGDGVYFFEGFNKVTTFTPMANWYLAFTQDREEFLAPILAIRNNAVIISIIASIITILLATGFSNMITKPVFKVVEAMQYAAEGDLTNKVDVTSSDEIGAMAGNFNKMLDSLKELIGNVNDTATSVSGMSDSLASSAENMSASIQEVAGSTNEFANSSHVLGSNCQEMAASADLVSENALDGEKIIEEAVNQMKQINIIMRELEGVVERLGGRSQEIGNIVGVITAIAEQTNLLALNAAIEAARAGEQGRGFAVVAEEVRKLAEQSAKAASEITSLIKATVEESKNAVESMNRGVEEVEEGSKIILNTGDTFKNIVQSVDSIVIKIRDVAAAAEQLSAGSQQMAATTEEQASSMEEVSISSEELKNYAEKLFEQLQKFKV